LARPRILVPGPSDSNPVTFFNYCFRNIQFHRSKRQRKKIKGKKEVKGDKLLLLAGTCKICYIVKLWLPRKSNGMKKNEMLSFVGKWMELESIILSEVSLAQKTKNRKNRMFSLICGH
jgi:hypothetical protein